MKQNRTFLLGASLVLALTPAALAGPPLICHALDIGNAKSLPWSNDTWSLSGKTDYDLTHLVQDTLSLLTPSTPVIVRMETLRRATIYANKDPMVAKELLSKLQSRALAAEKQARPDALAWFDLGYLAECYKQVNLTYKKLDSGGWEPVVHPNPASNLDGYADVVKAIGLRGADAEMEFAAALITLGRQVGKHEEHVRKATAGASGDPLLAQNLRSHFLGNGGQTVVERLTKVETAKN